MNFSDDPIESYIDSFINNLNKITKYSCLDNLELDELITIDDAIDCLGYLSSEFNSCQ